MHVWTEVDYTVCMYTYILLNTSYRGEGKREKVKEKGVGEGEG